MRCLRQSASLVAVLTLAVSALAAPAPQGESMSAVVAVPPTIRLASAQRGYTLTKTDAGVGCRDATPEEAAVMAKRGDRGPLHVIKSQRADKTATGLTIVLQATDQLEGFPAAKAAFIRAAADWESRIANTITVVVDVDFGPKNFGTPFDTNVIGSTYSQDLTGTNLYSSIRSHLLSGASSAAETALYTSLPGTSISTDQGSESTVSAASANLRALGVIGPVANPSTEQNFGDPPAIGFNSAFSYDFDPTNGIDFDKTDFNAVVLHELGHVLGFGSYVGVKEQIHDDQFGLTVLDIFRFRPGTTTGTFGSATRILSSGGSQVFFAGGPTLAFSTGRPDGTGGDGQQASHWKDNEQTGIFIGLMDPTIADGVHEDITENDLLAFDAIGYRYTGAPSITLGNLRANLVGNTLTITGTGQGPASITAAEVTLLDINTNAITDLPDTPLSIGTGGDFTLTFQTLGQVLNATQARVALRDTNGGTSEGTIARFDFFESGAPSVTKVKIKNGTKLKVTGDLFSTSMQFELNGQALPLPAGSTVKPTGKKATIELRNANLRQGPNRIRFLLNGKHSNIIVLTTS